MSSPLGFRYGAFLVLLPLAAFLSGPAASSVAPDLPAVLLLSALPTFLPLLTLALVGALAYRRSGSIHKALALTTFAFVVGIVGAIAYLLATWPTGG
jgi:hypothetical protein